MVFGVGLEYFFADERKRHVVATARQKERLRFPDNHGGGNVAYHFESLDFKATDASSMLITQNFNPDRLTSRGLISIREWSCSI